MSVSDAANQILNAEPNPDAKLIQNGRYRIISPTGDKTKLYTRVTTFAKTLEDTYNLQKWSQRMVLLGAAVRPDITAAALAAGPEDKNALNVLAEASMDAAKANVAREMGTALHKLCERHDMGETMALPPNLAADVAAYDALLKAHRIRIRPDLMEKVVVNEALNLAGRFDRFVEQEGEDELLVGDLKGLALETPIPTVDGWRTMESIQIGDVVFDRGGTPTPVLAKSEIRQRPCYRIRFDDGSQIVADDEHRWPVVETRVRKKTALVVTTSELATLMTKANSAGRNRYPTYAIINQGALDLPEADLPVDPYLLGVWLGDGTRGHSSLNLSEQKRGIVAELRRRGHVINEWNYRPEGRGRQFTAIGLITDLRKLGLAEGDKFVPAVYLRASAAQRLALLQGLMDTDGSWHPNRKQVTVGMTDKQMITDICELVASLGWRWSRNEHAGEGFGKKITVNSMAFTPHSASPFLAPSRKRDLAAEHLDGTVQCRRRSILAVTPTVSVRTQCIAVGGDHTFLCGAQMVPTHNTGSDLSYSWGSIAVQLACYATAETIYEPETGTHTPLPKVNQDVGLVFHLPAGKGQAQLYLVDLAKGREGIALVKATRAWRAGARKLARLPEEVLAPLLTPDTPDPVPTTVPDDTPVTGELRTYVERRVRDVVAAGRGEALLREWPPGVPYLKASKDHFEAEVDQILAVVGAVEGRAASPFPDYEDPRAEAQRAERKQARKERASTTKKGNK